MTPSFHIPSSLLLAVTKLFEFVVLSEVWGSPSAVAEESSLLGCYAALLGRILQSLSLEWKKVLKNPGATLKF